MVSAMTFYERVLDEYEFHFGLTNNPFLCENSETFKLAWGSCKKLTIIKHAEKYVSHDSKFVVGPITPLTLFLFYGKESTLDEKRSIRLDFLNWCIDNNLDI